MPKLLSKKLILTLVIALVIASATTGFAIWKYDSQPSNDTESKVKSANDCGDNRQCFYQAFNDGCKPAAIKVSYLTIEGDPIITTAQTATSDNGGCLVEAKVDSSQDKYAAAGQEVFDYTCTDIVEHDKHLSATNCSGENATQDTEVIL